MSPSAIDTDFLSQEGPKTMNMHNPPVKSIPHQDYPRMLYLWPKDKSLHPATKTAVAYGLEDNELPEGKLRAGEVAHPTDAGKGLGEKSLVAKGYRLKPHVQDFGEDDLPEGFEADIPKADAAGKANTPKADAAGK